MRLIFILFLFWSVAIDRVCGEAGNAAAPDPANLGRQALKTLIWGIKNPDSDVKVLAAEAFGDVGNPSAKKLLKEKLEERDGFVRVAAAKALWKLGDDSGIKVLREIISKVPQQADKKFPWLAMKALAQNKIREKAIDALVEIRGTGSIDFLQKFKTDPYGTRRQPRWPGWATGPRRCSFARRLKAKTKACVLPAPRRFLKYATPRRSTQ